jgi:hypothetical protein
MKKDAPVEEKGECAPIWIISFADMISLLMAFFILLLTMATNKSGKLCNDGGLFEQSMVGFRRSIAAFGLPGLLGNPDDSLYFNSDKKIYNISNGDSNSANRAIDAREERIRRLFKELNSMSKTLPLQMQGRRPEFSITPITFKAGQTTLDDASKQFLSKFVGDLQQARPNSQMAVYVVGVEPQNAGGKKEWLLAAEYAQTVAEFIKELLPNGAKVSVYSWGCGKGGELGGIGVTASKQAHILLGTLEIDEKP